MSWNSEDWKGVGSWLMDNAGTGAALVGSLITGNIPGAVASGVALVTSATGESSPEKVLASLQQDPVAMIRLKELAVENEKNIRQHIHDMTKLELEDKQKEHEVTQQTIRNGDNSDDKLVRWTRPLQSWLSLIFCGVYILNAETISIEIVMALLMLPASYAGLRQIGKWGSAKYAAKAVSRGTSDRILSKDIE